MYRASARRHPLRSRQARNDGSQGCALAIQRPTILWGVTAWIVKASRPGQRRHSAFPETSCRPVIRRSGRRPAVFVVPTARRPRPNASHCPRTFAAPRWEPQMRSMARATFPPTIAAPAFEHHDRLSCRSVADPRRRRIHRYMGPLMRRVLLCLPRRSRRRQSPLFHRRAKALERPFSSRRPWS